MDDLELFALDWERVLEALGLVVLMSFLIERVVALVVETRAFVIRTSMPKPGSEEALREASDVRIAREIIEAAERGKNSIEIQEVLHKLGPDSRLWQPQGTKSKKSSQQQAEEYLNWIERVHDARKRLSLVPVKEIIAFLVAAGACFYWNIDVFSFVLRADTTVFWGKVLTAALIAGGSKASIRLFHDLLGIRSHAVREMAALSKNRDRKETAA